MKSFKSNLLLYVSPVLFGLLILYLYYLRGPHYIQIPQDIAYQNIFNALNIIEGKSPGMLLYPAITLNYLFVLIIKITSLFSKENIFLYSLNNIEFICQVFSFISIIFLLSAIFFQSYIFKKKIFPITLIVLFQSSFFFVEPINLFLNLYISAEAILLILGITLLSTIKIFENNYYLKFTIICSILCSLAILTKLTALPLVLFPIFFIKDLKFKIYFFIYVIFFSIIFTFIIILLFNNTDYIYEVIRGIFYGLKNIILSSNLERNIISSNLSSSIIQQQIIIFKNYSLTFFVFFINLLIVAYLKFKKNKFSKKFYFFIIFIFLYYVYLSFRPKPHYFFIIHLFVMYSFIETIFYLKIKEINLKYDYFYSFALICIILIKSYLIIDSNFFKMIEISVQDAKNIRYIYDSKKTNKALVTAVQTSDKGSGFYHANEKRTHLQYISKILPSNEFNFNFRYDDEKIFSQNFNFFSMNDLMKNYDEIYFWTGNDKFQNIENDKVLINSKIPNYLYKKIYMGKLETISKVLGVKVLEKELSYKTCENLFCYKLYLPDDLKYNGIGIKYEDSKNKKQTKIFYNENKKLNNKLIEEIFVSKNFNQYQIHETKINHIKIISNAPINKIFMYQNINEISSEFEYIPTTITKGKSKENLIHVKQYNYSVENDDYIKIDFKEKIKPNKIALNGISNNFDIKIDLFGNVNDRMEYIKSAKNNGDQIFITLDSNVNSYSSYFIYFKIEKINKNEKLDFYINLRNKFKKFFLNYDFESANITSIDFIF